MADLPPHLPAACLTLLIWAPVAAEETVPDFSHSRPKGPRQVLDRLPESVVVPPRVPFGVFRPFNPIDRFIQPRLKDQKVRPAPVCDDWDFARRSSLDLAGIVPTVEDLDRYFDWKPEDRRGEWIDLVLRQTQYADHWTIFWGDLLRERGQVAGVPENALKGFIHRSLQQNRPFDAWVRDLVTASGSAEENPATAFFLQDRGDADVLTVAVSEAFLGIQLKCAQCHDHPFDWWTRKDFQSMAAFWRTAQSRAFRIEERTDARGRAREDRFLGVVDRPGRAGGVFLTGASSGLGDGREALADLITCPDNPYFARVTVNRLWEKMMGTGLVNPASNFSALNPPSHPELLDWLAKEFIASSYDLKHMLRLIANSRTYQQTSSDQLRRRPGGTSKLANTPEENEPVPGSLFESMPLRRMTAEQVHDSILAATGRYSEAGGLRPAIDTTYPPPPRSFLSTFGASDRLTIEPRPKVSTIQQTLTLLNGDFLNRAVRLHPGHPLRRWSETHGLDAAELVDALFYQILTRPPTVKERKWALKYVEAGRDVWAWEDLQWALFNSREFQFIR